MASIFLKFIFLTLRKDYDAQLQNLFDVTFNFKACEYIDKGLRNVLLKY